MLAMKGDFNLSELEHGLARVEKLRSDSNRSAPSHALAISHAGGGQTGTGGGARGRGRQGRRSGGRHDDGRGRHQQGYPRQMHHGQQHQPPAAMSQQSYAWQQQQQQQQYQPQFPQSQQLGPHHQQPNPWSSWGRPPHQQRRGRAHHQRRPRHRGEDQAHQQCVMYQQCGEEEHFPTDCVITMPAPTPNLYTAPSSGARAAQYGTGAHAAQYSTGAHVAQYGTHPLPPWTSHDHDGQSTPSAYGPPSSQASFAPAQPMPPPPRSVGPPPPQAPPLDSDWSFSSGRSQALQAQYVPPGEFSSSDLTDRLADGDSVGGSYLPSAFVGQPVGVDQVNDV